MKHYQAYLFDWDGTLADTLPTWWKILEDVCAHKGVKLTTEQKKRCFGRWPNVRNYVTMTEEEWEEFNALGKSLAHDRLKNIPLVDGTLQALQAIHAAGSRSAIITRTFRSVLGNQLEEHGLIGAFDLIIANEDSEKHKPDPDPLLKAMEELGVNAEETVMVGDADLDLIAAQRAGIESVLYYPRANEQFYNLDELKTHKPTHIIDDLRQIIAVQ